MSANQIDEERAICRLADLDDPGSRAFTLGSGDWPLKGFVVRKGEQVFAYLNRCPHAGHPLNWQPHEFLSMDRSALLCTSHGARFEITTGLCFAGPCVGRELIPLSVRIEDELVILDDDPDTLAARYA
ncbi:MAG: Rieske (2Fe-2S) protein [Candidatus Obscuribacterales bacterium]|nr:Rieske (2Fe-2S) protein [Steroidobacteraceae bacterium]